MNWGIKERILFLVLMPSAAIALLLVFYFTNSQLNEIEESLKERGGALTRHLVPATEFGLFSHNSAILQALSNTAADENDVSAVYILDKQKTVLAHTGEVLASPGSLIGNDTVSSVRNVDEGNVLIAAPVRQNPLPVEDFVVEELSALDNEHHAQPEILGWVVIQMSIGPTITKQRHVLLNSILILSICLGISAFFAYRMGRDVSEPIVQLTDAVDKIERGLLDTRVDTRADGELATLATGINNMAATLKRSHDNMEKRVHEATGFLQQSLEKVALQNKELEDARVEAISASRIKSEFLANMSHEIRTPMNGIIGFTKLLEKTELGQTQRKYLNTINRSATTLLTIINDILDFSKIEAGKMEFQHIPFDLQEALDDVFALLAPEAYAKKLEIAAIVYSDVPQRLVGDPERFKQVVINLLSNAVKFTDKGEIAIRAMLEEESDDTTTICISVEDTGIGIDEADIKKLFHAFSQADTSTTRQFGGTGLGLVISRNLVEKMCGTIGVESAKGTGSRFWFTFRADKQPHSVMQRQTSESLFGRKALVLEPHDLSRLSVQHALKAWGMEVTMLGNDIELYAHMEKTVREGFYDVIVMGLPYQEPFDDTLRQRVAIVRRYSGAPILALMNTSSLDVFEHVKQAGIEECISKPPNMNEFRQKLRYIFSDGHDRPEDKHDNNVKKIPTSWLRNLRILIAEDNPINQTLLNTLLTDAGGDVTVVENGEQAVSVAANDNFDLIFMDIHMPLLNGVESARQIRAMEKKDAHVPIIGISADVLSGGHEKYFQAGMDDYLLKPLDEEQLWEVIEKWTSLKRPFVATRPPTDFRENAVIDLVQGKQKARGNLELAKQLLRMLLEELPQQLGEIQTALEADNYDQLYDVAHKLYGSCSYCGVPSITQVVRELERTLYVNETEKVAILVDALRREAEKLQAEAARLRL